MTTDPKTIEPFSFNLGSLPYDRPTVTTCARALPNCRLDTRLSSRPSTRFADRFLTDVRWSIHIQAETAPPYLPRQPHSDFARSVKEFCNDAGASYRSGKENSMKKRHIGEPIIRIPEPGKGEGSMKDSCRRMVAGEPAMCGTG